MIQASIAIILVLFYIFWRIYFLRDPERIIPTGHVLVSPADGYILYIHKVANGEVPKAIKKGNVILLSELTGVEEFNQMSGQLIGIWMTPYSVHRNRIPYPGKIILKHHRKNTLNISMVRPLIETFFKRRSAREVHPYYLTNERLTTGISTDRGPIFVTQIADQWIDRIVSWVQLEQPVSRGEQYGMIRFGSQCDLFIPDSFGLKLSIQKGDYVYAGESVIGEHERSYN